MTNQEFQISKIKVFIANETAEFIKARPNCFFHNNKQASRSNEHGFFEGVPQHWMKDWDLPFPIYIKSANGIIIEDLDGNKLTDLCLGDTGAMFGHTPEPIKHALARSIENGLTTMLPSEYSDEIGVKLCEIFGLDNWQTCLTASDANRFALKVARLITGRQKIIVFDGCYHGAVDETSVSLDKNGRTILKPSLWGPAFDPSINTICVPFNDLNELEFELKTCEIAAIIAEPALTNCGIVLPNDDYWQSVKKLCDKYGTLLIIDETHTLSTGFGGYTITYGLEPDFMTIGKAIAGGIPTAVWGFSDKIATMIKTARSQIPMGHSGVGTTLSGSLLSLNALKFSLTHLITNETFSSMLESAAFLEEELNKLFEEFNLNWSITRLGARMEIIFSKTKPKNAYEMQQLFNSELEKAIHIGMINRGFLITPFHNMLLIAPEFSKEKAIQFTKAMREIIENIE